MKLHNVAFILLVVGGLNWLAVGLFNWDISQVLGGSASLASKAVYVLVGLSAVYEVATHKVNCRACAGTPSV